MTDTPDTFAAGSGEAEGKGAFALGSIGKLVDRRHGHDLPDFRKRGRRDI